MVSRAAHKLRGLRSVFSTVAADRASNLEDLANAGRFDECQLLVQQLKAMVAELIQPMENMSIESLQEHRPYLRRNR